MPTLKIYQVGAFTSEVFRGNPAAVCPLQQWLPDEMMQKIAAENNLSETAFYVPEKEGFHIRWFTPATEVELCGHATLASAHVLFYHEHYSKPDIVFYCKVGVLKVSRKEELITLDFPATLTSLSPLPAALASALSIAPLEYRIGGAFGIAVFSTEKEVKEMRPDFEAMKKIPESIIVVTAKGDTCDFVSRVFGPKVGIEEDPVTGSAHTRLIPYWSEKLKKKKLEAIQVSARRGYLQCEDLGERVLMSGKAVTYLVGEIYF